MELVEARERMRLAEGGGSHSDGAGSGGGAGEGLFAARVPRRVPSAEAAGIPSITGVRRSPQGSRELPAPVDVARRGLGSSHGTRGSGLEKGGGVETPPRRTSTSQGARPPRPDRAVDAVVAALRLPRPSVFSVVCGCRGRSLCGGAHDRSRRRAATAAPT
eukprot:213761-Chlamydomonas_euryale.AAC.2